MPTEIRQVPSVWAFLLFAGFSLVVFRFVFGFLFWSVISAAVGHFQLRVGGVFNPSRCRRSSVILSSVVQSNASAHSVKMEALEVRFGKTVRKYREKLGISQEEFAVKADIHRTYVSSVELGKVQVSIAVAEKLANALETPLSKLFRDVESSRD